MNEAKFRIGLQTLTALRKYDESAERAFGEFQIPGEAEIFVWVSPKTMMINFTYASLT